MVSEWGINQFTYENAIRRSSKTPKVATTQDHPEIPLRDSSIFRRRFSAPAPKTALSTAIDDLDELGDLSF